LVTMAPSTRREVVFITKTIDLVKYERPRRLARSENEGRMMLVSVVSRSCREDRS